MSEINIKPVQDRVIVLPDEVAEKTATGVYIPEVAKEKPNRGTIVALGEGRHDHLGNLVEMQTKVGDRVLYSKYGGTEITHEGVVYLIMRETDLYAVI